MVALEYNDTVIYPDKVRLNCYYYRHYSFVGDIQMIFCMVLGRYHWGRFCLVLFLFIGFH